MGGIEAAIERCQYGPFDGPESLAKRAALLLRGICQDHPFVDGNKRTAFAACDSFLRSNGRFLDVGRAELVEFMVGVAKGDRDVSDISEWLRSNLRKL